MSTVERRSDEDDESVDVDAAWAEMIARWEEAAPSREPGPSGDDRGDAGGTDGPVAPASPVHGFDWDTPPTSHVGGEATRAAAQHPEPGDDGGDDRFVPPEPPPLPRGDARSRLAWAGALGGPLFFLLSLLIWRSVPNILLAAAALAFVAGFITLVARLPDHRDDGWDDGAVL